MVHGLALASVVSQIGCVTVVIVVGALVAGLWVDKLMDTRPLFTVLFLLGSMPVSVVMLIRIALSTAAQFAPPGSKESADKPEKEK